MTDAPQTCWNRWWYSGLMLPVYLGIFHAWMLFPDRGIVVFLTLITVALLSVMLNVARQQRYFVGKTDLYAHAMVVLNIFIEGIIVPLHEGYSFYGCALAFVLVIGPYHLYCLRRRDADPSAHQHDTDSGDGPGLFACGRSGCRK